MSPEIKAFLELKTRIQDSSKQFRQNDENSGSTCYSEDGCVLGYDIKATNDALEAFAAAMPPEYIEGTHILTMTHKLLMSAQELSVTHPEMEVKEFARTVSAYLLMHVPVNERIRENPMRKLVLVGELSGSDEFSN